jgi:cytochrome P450
MSDVDDEIREIKREIIESRALVLKTSNVLSALAADVKSIAKRQAGYERRISWNSWVAYILFAALSFFGLWLAKNASVGDIEDQSSRLEGQVAQLQRELGEETQRAEARAHAEAQAAQFYRLIRERRASRGGERDDVLAMLIDARYEDSTPMRDEDLRDQLVTLVGAGHETSTSALAWVFQCLAHHPDAQARAHAEVEQSIEDDAELPWLDAVVKETLRLHAIFPLIARVLRRPMTIGGWDLPSGTLVYISIDLVHRNADLWPDPERFDPSRFGKEAPARPRHAYLPFGGGPRSCIGNKLRSCV